MSRDEDDEQFGTLTLNGKPLFESAWLKAAELMGRDVTVAIESVARCEVFNKKTNKKEFKVALMFVGKKKGLICNKTNAASIAKVSGQGEATNWIGQQITLYPTTCKVGRGSSDCIRIREKKPTQQKSTKPDATDLAQPNDPAQSYDRRIELCNSSTDAAQLTADIRAAAESGQISADERDELLDRLQTAMA